MTLTDLANREKELYSITVDIYDGKTNSENQGLTLDEIHSEYKNVHNEYSKMADKNMEALKRGLFIQWYALTEPNYLTGISELDDTAERKMITCLKNLIDQNKADNELLWMLNYYLSWGWVFDRFKDIIEFKKVDEKDKTLPPKIETDGRGQMGFYWNSILAE
jgi:hypothetical protein